jgi:hypothetical protein
LSHTTAFSIKLRRKKKLESVIWLNHAKGRAWSCETCTPQERRLRGNCGGPFKKGVKHGLEDESGRVYVPAYRIAPDSDPDWSDHHFYSCPVAGSNQCASVLNYYQYHKSDMVKLTDIVNNPTPALLEAVSVLSHTNDLRNARIRKQEEALNNG